MLSADSHFPSWQRALVRPIQVLLMLACLSELSVTQMQESRVRENRDQRIRYSDPFLAKVSPATVAVTQMRVSPKAEQQLRTARALFTKNDIAAADEHVERVLSKNPNYADALSVRARIRLRENRVSDAFTDITRALEQDSKLPNGYFVWGEILNHERRYTEALPVLERCIDLAPSVWQCHYERARALVGIDEVASALQEVERAAALGGVKEEPGAIYYLRGSAHMMLKDEGAGIADLEAFLRVSPAGQLAERVRLKLKISRAAQSSSVVPLSGPQYRR